MVVPRYQLAYAIKQTAMVTGLIDLAALLLFSLAALTGLMTGAAPLFYGCFIILALSCAAGFASRVVKQSGDYIIASSNLEDDDKVRLLREFR